jgi:predicted porin
MKKSLIALAALAAVSGSFAQSSVTLSGTVNAGIIKPIGQQGARINQAGNGANEIVFSGSEDLGGGLKANFRLSQRFNPTSGLNDGTTGTRPTFQGESTVGLSGAFGAVKIGRSLTAFQGLVNSTDPWGVIQQASTAVLASGYATDIDATAGSGANLGRTDGITYNSPVFSGFNGAVTYGPKTSASSGPVIVGAKALVSVWLSYANGPVMLGGGTENNRTGDRVSAVLGTYNLTVVKLGAGYSIVNPVLAGAANVKNYNLFATAPVGAFTLKAGYARSKTDGVDAATKKLGLGVDYSLSKRTTLYTSYGNNQGTSNATTARSGFDVGVKHTF